MDLSIIIVNYNGEKYLSTCLDSIKEQCKNIIYEVIIWDNASLDGSVAFLENNYSNDIILLKSKKNLGFAGGNNAAAKKAKGKYLLLLNNDTILLNSIGNIIELMETNNKIGVLGAKMLNGNKKYVISCGNLPKPHELIYFKLFSKLGGDFKHGNFNNELYEVGWVSGSFLLTTRYLWKEIGGLDESFFMYVEDVDYNKEVEKRGYKRIFHSGIEYVHFVGFSKTKNRLLIKGYKIYINKHFKGLNKIIGIISLNINKFIKILKNNYN